MYYSQIDNRWKNVPYTSKGDKSQTIETSGCGPTCAAMIVSGLKGNILPTEMADLYVKYGFRSSNNGTYWSAFRWTADVFNLEYKETYKLDNATNALNDGYMVIAACGNGLFTTGGHFIVLYEIDRDTISNLSGTKYYYLPNTYVKVLEDLDNINKIYVTTTGRIGYVSENVHK